MRIGVPCIFHTPDHVFHRRGGLIWWRHYGLTTTTWSNRGDALVDFSRVVVGIRLVSRSPCSLLIRNIRPLRIRKLINSGHCCLQSWNTSVTKVTMVWHIIDWNFFFTLFYDHYLLSRIGLLIYVFDILNHLHVASHLIIVCEILLLILLTHDLLLLLALELKAILIILLNARRPILIHLHVFLLLGNHLLLLNALSIRCNDGRLVILLLLLEHHLLVLVCWGLWHGFFLLLDEHLTLLHVRVSLCLGLIYDRGNRRCPLHLNHIIRIFTKHYNPWCSFLLLTFYITLRLIRIGGRLGWFKEILDLLGLLFGDC